jgi:Family of unknown function (DUF6174)
MTVCSLESRWRFGTLCVAVVTIVAGGCSVGDPTSPVERDVVAAHQRWQRSALANYTFVSAIDCFCTPEYTAPMSVTVRNGVVTAVTSVASGASQPLNSRQPIDSIFANLERQASENPSMLSAEFNATYGYPVRAAFGSLAADAGYVIYISALRPLP